MSNTTNVVGYYNGNRWPIQLVVSKLNITLTLEPGKYVLDRQGRKINDPYFEVFANNKQLHRELSQKAVPIISIPVVAPTVPTTSGNPVRAITTWARNNQGIRQPVLTEPAPTPQEQPHAAAPVVSSSESVTPMSMEEARRRGLVRKVRDVPEDYGVNDTTGLPPARIPQMKYSIDPSVNKPVAPLPKEMLTLPKDDPNRQTRAQLVAGLTKGAQVPAPENAPESPFANTSVVNIPPDSPIMAGTPITESAEENMPLTDTDSTDVALPEPDLTELQEAEAPAVTASLPPAPAPPAAPAAPLRPLTPKNQFLCIACGAPHKFRSQLFKHAQQKHPDNLNAIMAAYPEAPAV